MRIVAFLSVYASLVLICGSKCTFTGPQSVTVFSEVSLTIDSDSSESETLIITLPNESILISPSLNQSVNSTYPGSLKIYFTSVGKFSLKSSCNNQNSGEFLISVSKLTILQSFSGITPSTIGDTFKYKIDINNTLIEGLNISYSLKFLDQDNQVDKTTLITGTKEIYSNKNSTEFEGLRFTKKGKYQTKIIVEITKSTIKYKEEFINDSINISSSIQTVTIKCDPEIQQFVISKCDITVKGENENDYLDGYSVDLELDDKSNLGSWTKQQNILTSTYSLSFYVMTSGNKNLKAVVTESSNTVSKSSTININVLPVVIEIEPIKNSTSTSFFNIKLSIKSSKGEAIDISYLNKKNLYVQLISQGQSYSGTSFYVDQTKYISSFQFEIKSNPLNIINIKVLSSGTFVFRFSLSSDYTPSTDSNSFNSINQIKTLQFNTPNTFNYFKFKINLKVLGDDGNLYLGTSKIQISETSNLGLEGLLEVTTSNGNADYNELYFKKSGSATLKFKIGSITADSSFVVNQSKLSIKFENQPSNSESFSISVSVIGSSEINSDALFSHTIKLTLTDLIEASGSITSGNWTKTGTVPMKFDNLRILSFGSFKIEATSLNLTSIKTPSFSVANKVKKITISPNTVNIKVFESFALKLELKGEDDFKYIGNCIVSMDEVDGIIWTKKSQSYSKDNSLTFEGYSTKSINILINASTDNSISGIITSGVAFISSNAILNLSIDKKVIDMQPVSTKDSFKIIAKITNSNNQILKNANSVNIVLKSNGTENSINPIMNSITINNGESTSDSFYFEKSGYFEITGSGNSINEKKLVIGPISNTISKITLTAKPLILSIDTKTNIQVDIYGANQKILKESCMLLVKDNLSNKYIDEKIDTGTLSEDILLSKTTITSIKASSGSSEVGIDIKVHPLKINLSFTNIPKLSEDEFEIIATIKNYDDTIHNIFSEKKFSKIKVTLESSDKSNSGLVIKNIGTSNNINDGNLGEYDLTNGILSLGKYGILSSGKFIFRAISTSNYEVLAYSSDIFTISNKVSKVKLSIQNPTISVLQSVAFQVEVTGEDNKLYVNSAIIQLLSSSINVGKCEGSAGVFTCSWIPSATGAYSFTVKVDEVLSNIVTLDVEKWKLSSTILVLPETSSKSLSATFVVQDVNNQPLGTSNALKDCKVSVDFDSFIENSGKKLIGTLEQSISKSIVTFNDIKVLSSGKFKLKFTSSSCSEILDGYTSTEFQVTNSIKNIDLVNVDLKVLISVGQDVNFNITLFGDDDNLFLASVDVKMIQSIFEVGTCKTSKGFCTISWAPSISGDYSLYAKVEPKSSAPLPLKVEKWKITTENLILPQTSSQIFSAKFFIEDSNKDITGSESILKDCKITIDLTDSNTINSNTLKGNTSKNILNSEVLFDDIQVESEGTFQFKLSSNCSNIIQDFISEKFSINNDIKEIKIENLEPHATVYSSFNVKISIIHQKDDPYLKECITYLIDQEMKVKTYSVTKELNIPLVLKEIKTYTFPASCGGKNSSITITPQALDFELKLVDDKDVAISSTNSKITFYAIIKVIDSNNNVESKNYNNGSYPFQLNFAGKDSTIISGLVMKFNEIVNKDGNYDGKTSLGIAKIPITILSYGIFSLTVTSSLSPLITETSQPISSTNFLKSFTVQKSEATIFLPTDIKLNLKGDDDNALISIAILTLKNKENSKEIYSCTSNADICTFSSVILTKLGNIEYLLKQKDTSINLSLQLQSLKIKIVPNQPQGIEDNILNTNSDNSFDFVVNLKDNSQQIQIDSETTDKCKLTLTLDADTSKEYSGTVFVSENKNPTLSKGTVTFSSFKIKSFGDFFLKIESECKYIEPWTSSYKLSVENFPKSMTAKISKNIFTVYEYFDVTFEIKGDDDFEFKGTCTFSTKDTIKLKNNPSSYNGKTVVLSFFYEETGKFNPTISCESIKTASSQISLEILNQNMKFTFDPKPSDSKPFNLLISLTDKELNPLTTVFFKEYTSQITLSIITSASPYSGTKIEGTLYESIESGFSFQFNNLKILSSGIFSIKAVSNSEVVKETQSEQLTIINYIKTISCSTSRILETFFNFDLTISPIGDDENMFIVETNYLISISDSSLKGTVALNNIKGNTIFKNLYFTSSGLKSIIIKGTTIKESYQRSCELEVKKSSLKLNIDKYPKTSDDFFEVSASVVDSEGTIEKNNGPYQYKLTIVLDEKLEYSSKKSAISIFSKTKSAIFSKLNILSYGTYRLDLSTIEDINPSVSNPFLVINKIKSISIDPIPKTSNFQDLTISAKVLGVDDEPFKVSTNYSLIHNGTKLIPKTNTISGSYESLKFVVYSQKVEIISFSIKAEYSNFVIESNKTIVNISQSTLILNSSLNNLVTGKNFEIIYELVNDLLNPIILKNFDVSKVSLSFSCIKDRDYGDCKDFSFTGESEVNSKIGQIVFNNIKITKTSKFNIIVTPEDQNIKPLTSGPYVADVLVFKLTSTPTEIKTSKDIFELTIFSYFDDLQPMSNVFFSIYFRKTADSIVSGEKMIGNLSSNLSTDKSGIYKFTGLKILSSGEFEFVVVDKVGRVFTLQTGFIKNSIKSIEFKSQTQVQVNFPLTLNYSFYGDDDFLFTQPIKITLTEEKSLGFNGDRILNTSKGQFQINLLKSSQYSFKVASNSSDMTALFLVNSLKNTLYLNSTFDALLKIKNSQIFTFNASVYGLNILETYIGKYQVNISAVSNIYKEVSEKITMNLAKGVGEVSYQIKIPGTYTFTVDSHSELNFFYSKKMIIEEDLGSFKITSTISDLATYNLTHLNIELIGYSGEIFTFETTLELNCNDSIVIINSSTVAKYGKAKFLIYFKSLTSNSQTSCELSAIGFETKQIIDFTINKELEHNDEKCFVGWNEPECYKCINNSRLNETGYCECDVFSEFNATSRTCDCFSSFKSKNNFCIKCGYFFKPEEIKSYFGSDLKSIIFEFMTPANVNILKSTQDWLSAFGLQGVLSTEFSSGLWLTPQNCSISFKRLLNDSEQENKILILNPVFIQKSSLGVCNEKVYELRIPVKINFLKPVPLSNIFAPSQVSSECGDIDITAYTTVYNPRYTYKWSSNDKTVDDTLKKLDSQPKISFSLKTNSTFKISVKITDTDYKTSSIAETFIHVLNEKILTLNFPLGTQVFYKTSQNLPVKVEVSESCGEDKFEFEWALNDSFSESSLLKEFKTDFQNQIVLRNGFLKPEMIYFLTAEASSNNGFRGKAVLKIYTVASPLDVTFNRAPGSVSSLFDLELSALVNDPDQDYFNNFTYRWSCLEGSDSCKDQSGKEIVKDETKKTLIIPKKNLKSESFYNIRVQVSRSNPSKKATSEVLLYISDSIKGIIKVESISYVQNPKKSLSINPSLQLEGNREVTWHLSPSIPSLDLKNDYLLIPENTLNPGTAYIIEVSLKPKGSSDTSSASATLTFKTNSAPTCEAFIAKYNGLKVELTAEKCRDLDSDSHLLYQFGFSDKEGEYWMTKSLYSSSFKLMMHEGVKAMLKVCDELLACNVLTSTVSGFNNSARLLAEIKDIDDFIEDIDEIPSLVSYFAVQVKSDSDFRILFEKLQEYAKSNTIDENDENLLDNLISTLSNLVQNGISQAKPSQELLRNISNFIKENLSPIKIKLTSKNFEMITNCFSFLISGLEEREISELLDIFARLSLMGTFPKSGISNSYKNFTTFRTFGKDLNESKWQNESKISLLFPADLSKNDSIQKNVYDVITAVYDKDMLEFEVTLIETGTENNNKLDFYDIFDRNVTEVKTETGISIFISGEFEKNKDYSCRYLNDSNDWSEGGCKVIEVKPTSLQLQVTHLSIFSIQEQSSSISSECKTGGGPVALMAIIIIVSVAASLAFRQFDREIKIFPLIRRFFLFYPVTSLFYKQPGFRRNKSLLQISCSALLMLALIGAFLHVWEENNEENENSYNFKGKHAKSGVVGWILTQIIMIPVIIFNGLLIKHQFKEFWKRLVVVWCFSLDLVSVIVISVMTIFNCEDWSLYLVVNWVIFMIIDLIALQPLISLIFSLIIKEISGVYREVKSYENDDKTGFNNSLYDMNDEDQYYDPNYINGE